MRRDQTQTERGREREKGEERRREGKVKPGKPGRRDQGTGKKVRYKQVKQKSTIYKEIGLVGPTFKGGSN